MLRLLNGLVVTAIAASLLSPATAIAKPAGGKQAGGKQAGGKRHLSIVVHPKYPPKHRWRGYGFLPGYRQPPQLADWRYRSARYRGPDDPYERRYWYDGQLLYGWGRPGFYGGRWTGGSFGPCWTSTPIGMMWTCGR
jgi:hypothetical protein